MELQFTTRVFPFFILLMLGCRLGTPSRINKEASISSISKLSENPLTMTPMAVSLQPETNTMSTLYGNSIAANRLNDGAAYATGSVLYLVSWKGKADPDWFGARIPDRVMVIERVSIDQQGQKSYAFFKGPAWHAGVDLKKDQRQAIILAIPIATSPRHGYQGIDL